MNKMKKIIIPVLAILSFGVVTSCNELVYPEAGSIEDKTPPKASFGMEINPGNYQEVKFDNFSISATDFMWDFGDGQTSTEKSPTATFADGRYLVSLTASDKLGKIHTSTDSLIIEKPTSTFKPVIQNPGYDIVGDDSYRDFWRNGDLGGVIQITSSPVHEGEKSAKLPSDGSRIGYQLITVEEDTDYILSWYYTMNTSPAGSMTISVLNGPTTNPANIAGNTIESKVCMDQTDAGLYVPESLEFNSGPSTQVAIYFSNVDVESRIDTWTIDVK
jgi:PKD repeat protein